MHHIKPKKGMLVMLASVKEIEDRNIGKSPVKVGTLGQICKDPDGSNIFEVEFFQKTKRDSWLYNPQNIKIACIPSMVDLVIDQKIKVTTVTTALVTKDFKKV